MSLLKKKLSKILIETNTLNADKNSLVKKTKPLFLDQFKVLLNICH